MSFFSQLCNALFEFIFPKPEKIIELESMTPAEMVKSLPPAPDTGDEHTVTVFGYSHPVVRELVWELKYRGNRAVAEKLARVLMDVLRHELAERALYENFADPLLIPMPISDKRRNERGYNQTEILASEMKRLEGEEKLFKVLTGQLVKHRHTERQVSTGSREERLKNLKDSMRVIHSPAVAGRNIILLDDVTTTGATFAEARRALKEAGAKKILCLAVAH